jgi:hypothetical protein
MSKSGPTGTSSNAAAPDKSLVWAGADSWGNPGRFDLEGPGRARLPLDRCRGGVDRCPAQRPPDGSDVRDDGSNAVRASTRKRRAGHWVRFEICLPDSGAAARVRVLSLAMARTQGSRRRGVAGGPVSSFHPALRVDSPGGNPAGVHSMADEHAANFRPRSVPFLAWATARIFERALARAERFYAARVLEGFPE